MKRFIAVLSGILVLPAFAEVAPVYYDEIVEYTDEMLSDEPAVEEETAVQPKSVAQRNTINRSTTASRAVSSATNSASARTNKSSRAVASSSRSGANVARTTTSRTTRKNNVANRSATNSRTNVKARSAQNTQPVTARVGTTNNSVMSAARMNTTNALRNNATRINMLDTSSESLYLPNTASDASRVGMRVTGRGQNTGAISRLSTSVLSTATTPVVTEEDVSSTTSNLNAISELTDYCKAQYAACMDNYCNVLDDNQGRCSCSKNLKNYEKTEIALANATEEFQEAVQKIRYIGLTGPQIESLFAETEAELAMKSNTDSSQLKSNLDTIKRRIVEVSSPTASSYEVTNGLSLDLNGLLNADFTAGFDLNSFLGTNKTNTTSVSNQRGEQLYKTATNRCKTAVLNSCAAQGIDANVITNAYDLEIDKQCIAYERALTEANKEMKNNVFNATNILQQARLLLTQNKNSYDLRGCVAAIDSCMQDEYVCGSDYELCLDPTNKYLANAEVIKGSTPGISGGQHKNLQEICELTATSATPATVSSPGCDLISSWTSKGMYDLYATWNYDTGKRNAWGNGQDEKLSAYIEEALGTWKSNYTKDSVLNTNNNIAVYLLQKVGYIDGDDKVHGMCASVMKQCQDYTFNSQKSTKKFIPDNEVVRQYLTSALSKIKVQQDAILSDYAEGCRTDVQSCLSTNGFDDSNTTSTASKTAVNACAAEITTCMSVGGYMPKDGTKLTLRAMNDWVSSILISCPADYYLYDTGDSVSCKPCPRIGSLASVSAGGQATICSCPEGYTDIRTPETENGVSTGRYQLSGCTSSTGTVSCAQGYSASNGECVSTTQTTSGAGSSTSTCPTAQIVTRCLTDHGSLSITAMSGSVQTSYTGAKCQCPTNSQYNTMYVIGTPAVGNPLYLEEGTADTMVCVRQDCTTN